MTYDSINFGRRDKVSDAEYKVSQARGSYEIAKEAAWETDQELMLDIAIGVAIVVCLWVGWMFPILIPGIATIALVGVGVGEVARRVSGVVEAKKRLGHVEKVFREEQRHQELIDAIKLNK